MPEDEFGNGWQRMTGLQRKTLTIKLKPHLAETMVSFIRLRFAFLQYVIALQEPKPTLLQSGILSTIFEEVCG